MTELERWAASGAMWLTGDPGGPPLAPPTRAAQVIDEALAPFGLDARVVAERAALLGLSRRGRLSCGGATRLLPAADGWIALSLARPTDVDALPALLEDPAVESADARDAWRRITPVVASRSAPEIVERGALLGLACGRIGEAVAPFEVRGSPRGDDQRPASARPPTVADLSTLWAGPLAASLLLRDGAAVVKVEDRRRPDGSRRGIPAFFHLLNGGKRSVALDFADPRAREALADLVLAADIVITSSRSRAIDQLGLDPERFLASGADKVWVAITGHGWAVDRVAFGDDAAATAGLVAWHPVDGKPRFAGDAIADPLCGALAAAAARDAWATGGRWFVDASLAGAAAVAAGSGPARAAEWSSSGWQVDGVPVARPMPREAGMEGPALGADTETALAGSWR